jgi:hypothetical protein
MKMLSLLWIVSIQSCSITILSIRLHEFAKFLKSKYGYEIPFKGPRGDDFLDFQTSIRKSKATDPLHKWVGEYIQSIFVESKTVLQIYLLS